MYALVTGGSRGIGRAVAVKLAKMGYQVIINYMSNDVEAEKTLAMIREAGSDGELLKFDVSDATASQAAIEGWQTAHPNDYIEVLVNNAGIRKDNLLVWMEPAEFQRVLTTNLFSFYNVTHPLIQSMIRHKYGRIVNMASLSGLKGLPGQCNYSAAKGGLIAAERGATGGYRLTTSPDEITVGQVLATAEGAIHAVACLEENAAPCHRVEQCKTVGLWRKLDELVDGYLAKVTLAQLVEGNVPQA